MTFMKKKRITLLVLASSFLLFPVHGETKSNPTKTTLTLVTENLPPYQMLEAGKITGFATEIITQAMEEANIDYQIKMYPWSRSYNYAQKKQNACIYSIARIPERESLFQWTQPIAVAHTAFIGLSNKKNITLNSINDAKKYITAVLRDDVTHHLLVRNGFKEFDNFFVVNNSDSLLKLLITRKNIDFILVDPSSIPFRAAYNHVDEKLFKIFFSVDNQQQTFYLACSNATSPEIIKKLNKAITTIKENGTYSNIINKWSIEYGGVL
jgi:polar amino acid transport system substrate-binding protein